MQYAFILCNAYLNNCYFLFYRCLIKSRLGLIINLKRHVFKYFFIYYLVPCQSDLSAIFVQFHIITATLILCAAIPFAALASSFQVNTADGMSSWNKSELRSSQFYVSMQLCRPYKRMHSVVMLINQYVMLQAMSTSFGCLIEVSSQS